ncbi:MAG: peptidyl-prolyl cis-trans isomerase [Porticoccaceae bacterium]|nr:peptidyl-prolyl cis-trans isomerase [Porticoccaceae bacterium]MBT7374787.1 peptidyl-prolyl cis-trans isomerase [Porticoccaceae bacterium]
MKMLNRLSSRRWLLLIILLLPMLLAVYWVINQENSASQKDWDADRYNLPDISALEQRIEIELFGTEPEATRDIGADIDMPLDIQAMEAKLAGLTKNVTTLRQPTEQELQSYFQRHEANYRRDSYFSFRHMLFSTAAYGGQAYDRAERELLELKAGAATTSQPSSLKDQYYGVSSSEIDRDFGNNFSTKMIALSLEGDQSNGSLPCWAGPITSAYGAHLICIEKLVLGAVPRLEDVRAQVINDWRYWISTATD